MKGLIVTAGLGLALAAAQPALAENPSASDKIQEYQVAAADQAQVDAFLNDSRPVSGMTVPDLRARMRAGRALIDAGGLAPAAIKQVRGKIREARDEITKRGAAKAPATDAQGDSSQAQKPAAERSAAAKQQQAQAEASPEVARYLAEKPDLKSLDPAALRNRVRTGRGLIQGGKLAPKDRRAVAEAVRAAQTELKSRQSQAQGDQGTKPQPDQAQATKPQPEKAAAAQSAPEVQTYLAAKPDLKALDAAGLRNRIRTGRALLSQGKASGGNRRAVIEAMRAAQAELKSRSGGSGTQTGQQQGQGTEPQTGQGGSQVPADRLATNFLNQQANLKAMSDADLRQRVARGRQILGLGTLSVANRQTMTEAVRLAQSELQSRNKGTEPDQNQAGGGGADATALANDNRNPQALSDGDLNQRLRRLRAVLAQRNLPAATQRTLRQKLAADRTELRKRIANRDRPRQQGQNQQQQTRPIQRPRDFYLTDRRRSRELEPWDLRQRITNLTIIINTNSYPQARRDEYAALLAADRAELRQRYLANRSNRLTRLRDERSSGKLNIGINVNIGSPPPLVEGYPQPVYVAEADDEVIERQFVAPPVRKPARRYTVEEVVNDEEVRRTMPAVELDTVKFGFNEDFIREEALDDMDKVGDIIERILAAHPDEIFLIEGHTDAVGSDSYNLDLSTRRAAAVKEALTTYYNIEPGNLKTVGYGERYLKIPVQEEEPENRRATLRRVTPLVGEAS